MNSQVNYELIDRIKQRFSPINIQEEPSIASNGNKAASVLVPLAFHKNELMVLYTHRSNHISRHRGQVSFPGGMEETGDITYLETALRETYEEIGIRPEHVEVFGRLTSLVSTSGYLIHPYVGFIKDLNGLQKNPTEVEKIFCIPLEWILVEGNLALEDYQSSSGDIHKVWALKDFNGEKVWGITGEITRRFIEKIK